MRLLPITLCALLVLIQYPLWLGKGGWVRVWDLDRQLEVQQLANQRQHQKNAVLESEVGDLKQGLLAIEERARYELGMVRPDEVYVQINPSSDSQAPAGSRAAPTNSSSNRDSSAIEMRTADARAASRQAETARRSH